MLGQRGRGACQNALTALLAGKMQAAVPSALLSCVGRRACQDICATFPSPYKKDVTGDGGVSHWAVTGEVTGDGGVTRSAPRRVRQLPSGRFAVSQHVRHEYTPVSLAVALVGDLACL